MLSDTRAKGWRSLIYVKPVMVSLCHSNSYKSETKVFLMSKVKSKIGGIHSTQNKLYKLKVNTSRSIIKGKNSSKLVHRDCNPLLWKNPNDAESFYD